MVYKYQSYSINDSLSSQNHFKGAISNITGSRKESEGNI